MTTLQHQYITNWHDSFVDYIGSLLCVAEKLIPEINMIGYVFDFERIKELIIKMTDSPDKVYSVAPLRSKG